jgi:hypothetical protein
MNRNDSCESGAYSWKIILLYAVLVAGIVVLPPLLAVSGLPSICSSRGESYKVFEIFGFCSMAALAVTAYIEIRRRRFLGSAGIVPVVIFVLVCGYFAILISECTYKSGDYGCYTSAAEKILQDRDPYGAGYLYPPIVAEGMAGVYLTLTFLVGMVGARATDSQIWANVFYLWQCAQFFLAVAAYLLSVRFVKTLGARGILPVVIVAVVYVFNIPLLRTINWNQANLLMLVSILCALVFIQRRPYLAGGMLAVGACIKLYPLAILLPVILTRRWKALAGFVIAGLAIVAIDTGFGRHIDFWRYYLNFMQGFPQGFPVGNTNRDNSLFGVLTRSAWYMAPYNGYHIAYKFSVILWRVASAAAGVWIALRFMKREKSFAAIKDADAQDKQLAQTVRFSGHVADILALALLASPLVWEHHYVLAVPVILWAIISQHRRNIWLIGFGSLLILLPPTFNIWPLSYHRLFGLLILIAASSPFIDLAEHKKNISSLQNGLKTNWTSD